MEKKRGRPPDENCTRRREYIRLHYQFTTDKEMARYLTKLENKLIRPVQVRMMMSQMGLKKNTGQGQR